MFVLRMSSTLHSRVAHPRAPALLASAPDALVRADARAPALLAVAANRP